jgi:hypothetical protein
MSIEQTTQLLNLILNTVLFAAVCVGFLVVGAMRRRRVQDDWQAAKQEEGDRPMVPSVGTPQNRWHVRHLRYLYQLETYSVVAGYYALLCSLLSSFVLALRTLVNWNGLISLAMLFFVVGIGLLLLAVGFALFTLHVQSAARSVGWDGDGTHGAIAPRLVNRKPARTSRRLSVKLSPPGQKVV